MSEMNNFDGKMAAQTFDFGFTGQKGIAALVRAKGFSLTLIAALLLVLLFLIFFALLPYRATPELLGFRAALVLCIMWVCYFYARTVVRVDIDTYKLGFQLFTRATEFDINQIKKIVIYEFVVWGIGFIVLNSNSKSYLFFFWIAPFDGDRRLRFHALIEHLRLVSRDRFDLKVK